MRRLLAWSLAALLWGGTAAAVIAFVAMTNARWNAEAGYLFAGAAVAGAWTITQRILRRGRLHYPYRPRR